MLVKSKISAWPGSMPRTFIRDKMCVFMDGRKGDGTNTLTGFSHTFKNRETQMKLMSVLRKKKFQNTRKDHSTNYHCNELHANNWVNTHKHHGESKQRA